MEKLYIGLVDTPGLFAWMIRKAIRQDYIHVVLGMDEMLDECYSVGRRFPSIPLLAVLMLSLIISGYLRTRMKNYSMYIALGIRNKTLIRIVGLEYGTCILTALAGGILLGLGLLKIIGVPITGKLLRILPAAMLCYLLVVLISTLVNYKRPMLPSMTNRPIPIITPAP